jgi:O-antigen/teichoic acid export membrane protein
MNSEISFNPGFARENLKLGAPLIFATLLSGSAEYIDGFIVTSMFDEQTFAVFRYGARELPLAILLANALNVSLLPSFSNRANIKENLENLKSSVTRLLHLLFPLSAILILLSHSVFPLIFNAGFEKSATIFNIYMMLVVSRIIMPQTILNGMKYTKDILIASVFELILNVSISLFLVSLFGINGVAAGTFFAFIFEKMYLHYALKRKLNINLSEYLPVKLWLLYSTVLMLFFIFAELIF